jgi:hypothetical protein
MWAAYASELWHELFVGVAGASLVAQRGGGLYWLVPAIVLLLGVGVMNAWVLLVEILR